MLFCGKALAQARFFTDEISIRHLLQDGEAIESRRHKETSFGQAGRHHAIESTVEFRR